VTFCITPHFSAYSRTVFSYTLLSVLLLPVASIADSSAAGVNSPQPLLEKFEKGFINWQIGEYVANVSAPVPAEYRGKAVNQAMGKELALRVSRALADSVFLQIVAETRVDAKNRLSQLVKGDSEIKLTGNIRGKELIDTKWVKRENKLWLEASYRISMRGVDGVISNIYDKAIEARPAMSPASAKSPANSTNKQDKNSQTVVYIDARGTGLQPALFPCIMDQQHARLFDPAKAGKSYIAENGVVEYVVSNNKEPLSSLVDINNSIIISSIRPTILDWLITPAAAEEAAPVRKRKKRKAIKATDAEGLLKSNIIVSKEDAEKLRQSQEKGELDTNPRIIVITDGTVGGTEGRLIEPYSIWAFLSPE
jgi:hypothetical protein